MSIDALSKQAVQDCRRKLQTDLWELLHILYPPPKYYWSASVHKPICEKMFVQKNPDRLINDQRSEEHTSELQSQSNLVCRLLLEKKKNIAFTVDNLFLAS